MLTSGLTFVVGSFCQLFMKIPLLENILAGFGAVLFSVYLAFDTQMIIGGKHHKRQYGQNEYILAALNIYQDALNLFIQIMKILAKSNNKSRRRK